MFQQQVPGGATAVDDNDVDDDGGGGWAEAWFACWPLDDGDDVDVEVGADEAMMMGLVDIFVQPLPGNRDSLVFHSAR